MAESEWKIGRALAGHLHNSGGWAEPAGQQPEQGIIAAAGRSNNSSDFPYRDNEPLDFESRAIIGDFGDIVELNHDGRIVPEKSQSVLDALYIPDLILKPEMSVQDPGSSGNDRFTQPGLYAR